MSRLGCCSLLLTHHHSQLSLLSCLNQVSLSKPGTACCYMLYIHISSLNNGPVSFLLKNIVISSPRFLHSLALWILLHLSTLLVNDHRWYTSPCRVTSLGKKQPCTCSSSEASTTPQAFPSQRCFSYPKHSLLCPVSAFITWRFMQAEMKCVSLCVWNKSSLSASV